MVLEFEKWKTGKKVKGKADLVSTQGSKEIDWEYDMYEAPLGDLITDYINHINKPWWKRKYNHNFITKKYLEWLNNVKLYNQF